MIIRMLVWDVTPDAPDVLTDIIEAEVADGDALRSHEAFEASFNALVTGKFGESARIELTRADA